MSSGKRIAALDVGTNTVLLLIAERRGERLLPVLEQARITRLGKGVDGTARIAPEAALRTLAALTDYSRLIREHGVERAAGVCTSAARDASNGAEFLQRARDALGFPLDIIDGTREAALTFRGALSGLSVDGPVCVFDIGGGSTEIIVGHQSADGAQIARSVSLEIGSVRLTERHVTDDPPRLDDLRDMRADIRAALSTVQPPDAAAVLVGVAGTVTTLSALSQGLETYVSSRVHGSSLDSTAIAALVKALGSVTLAERQALPGLEPGRADVIVAGALLVEEILAWARSTSLRVSDRGVRWGLALELA